MIMNSQDNQSSLQNEIDRLKLEITRLESDAVRYDLLKRTAGFAILTLQKYVFIDCNKKAEEIFGLPRDEIIGREPFMFSPKYQSDGSLSTEKAMEIIDTTLKESYKRFEWEHVRGDGSRFFADVSLNKVVVNNEEFIQVIMIDISEQKVGKERLENQNKIIRRLNKQYQQQNKEYEDILNQLQNQRNLTDAILSNINDGVVVFSRKTIVYINEQIYFILGESLQEFTVEKLFASIGLSFDELILPDHKKKIELYPKGKNNDKYFRLQIISMNDPEMFILHLSDYTEVQKAHRSIEESEFKFRSIFHYSTDSIILLSDRLKIREVNETFLQGFDFPKDHLFNSDFLLLFASEDREKINKVILSNHDYEYRIGEFRLVDHMGNSHPVEVGFRKIRIGLYNMYLAIIHDISFRKKFEQQLFSKIIQTEENERKRVAANLHDELGPILSSLKLYNNTLKNSRDENYKYLAGQLDELLTEAVDTTRRLSDDLSPVTLYKGGLDKAIKKRLDSLREFFKIIYKSQLNNSRFSEHVEINLFRITNELINNTIKHANAKEIKIEISFDQDNIYFKYSDDGQGFEPVNRKDGNEGRGTSNILGRLKSVSATYKIQSEKGKGVRYNMTIPYTKE